MEKEVEEVEVFYEEEVEVDGGKLMKMTFHGTVYVEKGGKSLARNVITGRLKSNLRDFRVMFGRKGVSI